MCRRKSPGGERGRRETAPLSASVPQARPFPDLFYGGSSPYGTAPWYDPTIYDGLW